MDAKPYPTPNADTAPFWDGCNSGALRWIHCDACGKFQASPRAVCRWCRSTKLGWKNVTPRGTVATFTEVHRGPSAAFKPDQPYLLALIEFDEGFRLMMNLRDVDPAVVRIGMAVRIAFEPRGPDGQRIPQAMPEGQA